MAKDYSGQNFQEFNETERNTDATVASELHVSCSDAAVQQERNIDATLELPASKSATAKYFGISRSGLDWWIIALEDKGYPIVENRKIDAFGFGYLQHLDQARKDGLKPSEFVEGLPISDIINLHPEVQRIPESEYSEAINPYQIEVPPLPELPTLTAEIVQVDTPEILKQKSINDKLQDLIEVATARTHQQIEEANRVAAQTQAAQNQITQLAKLHEMSQQAQKSQDTNQATLEQMGEMLKSLNSLVGK